ncbi:hypothetical protein [Streptomyces sp. NBC_01483]|uniref:hypothetical protein n=1 Tax=Streptomyces sp. NBC_01483 TaxID=2903883 RepID=UPI002E322B26|nr:hypothetical protein [Streptomyces sp. NBC_01483]
MSGRIRSVEEWGGWPSRGGLSAVRQRRTSFGISPFGVWRNSAADARGSDRPRRSASTA